MTKLPYAPIRRILTENNERVSDEAVITLEQILSTFATDISIEASKLAKHAGRKTVKAEDIELVV